MVADKRDSLEVDIYVSVADILTLLGPVQIIDYSPPGNAAASRFRTHYQLRSLLPYSNQHVLELGQRAFGFFFLFFFGRRQERQEDIAIIAT